MFIIFIIIVGFICVVCTLLAKATSGTIGDEPTAIGREGESRTRKLLNRLADDHYIVLNDLIIADSKGWTTQIDHIIVSPFGIFVIETKCYKGWIFGDEKSRVWTQSLMASDGWMPCSVKHTFQNPIRQNWRHIYVLAERLKLPKKLFVNVVVFSGTAEFKCEMPRNVMPECEVLTYIKSFQTVLLARAKVDDIVYSLMHLNRANDEGAFERHVYNLQVAHVKTPTVDEQDSAPKCPCCGAIMRKRYRHKDRQPFYGCTHYPNCKGIVKIKRG